MLHRRYSKQTPDCIVIDKQLCTKQKEFTNAFNSFFVNIYKDNLEDNIVSYKKISKNEDFVPFLFDIVYYL